MSRSRTAARAPGHATLARGIEALPHRRGSRTGRSTTNFAMLARSRAASGSRSPIGVCSSEPWAGGLLRQPLHSPARAVARLAAPARDGVLSRPARERVACRSSTRLTVCCRRTTTEIERIQVTHRDADVVSRPAIDAAKVFRIPIGVEASYSSSRQRPRNAQTRARRSGYPQSAFVVGSFQKDGVGWDDG